MSAVNNKRIAKNTLYLYLRMLLVMGIGLYTVRAILDILGVVDYGIYNVIGGVVTMFAFMNKTLSTSSQRYFSIELAKKDYTNLNRIFCLNLTVFSLIGLIMFVLLETIGLWFVNYKMTIPEDRLYAANVVYQLSIISMLFHIVVIPYMALVISHEKMQLFAIIGVLEAVGKLAIVFFLNVFPFDKLIVYGILILIVSLSVSLVYIIYCLRNYPESRFHWYWNKSEAFDLLGFSGWHFLGTFSITCRSQGINILLNLFFSPAVNAARAVAYQIYHAVQQLVSNFFTAVKPQIYKSYASERFDELYKLVTRSSIICLYLVSLLVFPFIANTELILGLWLKEVPEYTVIFTQLVLLNGLLFAVDGPLSATALATGKIRNYELAVCFVILANIPVSYVALRLGAAPSITMVISIVLSVVDILVRTYMLKRMMSFPMRSYLFAIFKVGIVSVLLYIICRYIVYNSAANIIQFILWSIVIVVLQTGLYFTIITKEDRNAIVLIVRKKFLNDK